MACENQRVIKRPGLLYIGALRWTTRLDSKLVIKLCFVTW